jgi:hypothetical protein
MPTPIIEQIAAEIKTTLDGLATSGGNLDAIRPSKVDLLSGWGDLTCLVNQAEAARLDGATMTAAWMQSFLLVAIVIDSDKVDTSIDTRLNTVRADIEKQLMVDLTRGGLAKNTTVEEATPFEGEPGEATGIAIKITVHYATADNDPYTKM